MTGSSLVMALVTKSSQKAKAASRAWLDFYNGSATSEVDEFMHLNPDKALQVAKVLPFPVA